MLGRFEELLLGRHVLLLAAATMVIMWSLRKIWRSMDESPWIRRLKPVYPILICQGFALLPGIMPQASLGERILTAIWAAFCSMFVYQTYRRIIGAYGIKAPERIDKVSYSPKKPCDKQSQDKPR